MKVEELYVVEYSSTQHCLNYNLLGYTLNKNLENAKSNKTNDYQIVYIGTLEMCETFIKDFEEVYLNV